VTSPRSAAELEARRLAPTMAYAERKASTEARVTRWVWATGPFYSLEPFDAERGGWPRGRLCKQPPKQVAGKYEFGLDEHDRLWVIRKHTEFEGRCDETFVDAEDPQWVWSYRHRDQSVVYVVNQRIYEGDRLVATAGKSAYGHSSERYRWEDGQLRAITVELDTGDTQAYELAYTAGILSEIRIVRAGAKPHVVFSARKPDLKVLLAAMAERLPEVVHQRVAAAKETRPAFCLVLSYSDESAEEMAMPALSLGLEVDRTGWRSRGEPAAELWNPARFATHGSDALELADGQLTELAAEIARGLRAPRDYAAVKKTYVAVARTMLGTDWRAVIPTTEDFTIVAVNVDMSDLEKNLRAIVGAAGTKQLKRDGLL